MVNSRLCKSKEKPDYQRENDGKHYLKNIVDIFGKVYFWFHPFNDFHSGKCHEYQHDNRKNQCDYNVGHLLYTVILMDKSDLFTVLKRQNGAL